MSKVAFIKGARTRYRNILDKEIRRAIELLVDDDSEIEIDDKIVNAIKCLERIKVYSEKIESQGEKLAAELADDESNEIDKILNEDCELCSVAMDKYFELKEFKEGLIVTKEKENVKEKEKDESDTKTLINLQKNMQQLLSMQMKQQELSHKKQTEQCSTMKLPKMEMISFSGDKTHWLEFWDSFRSAVHDNKSISNVDKFNYLKSKLFGEAKGAIAGLSLTNENYPIAIDLLRERFGNVQEIVDLHYNRLINMPPASNKISSLRYLLDNIERHLRSLEVLKQKIDQDIFVSIVKSKLPEEVLIQLEVQKEVDLKWTVQELKAQLRKYVIARERASKGVAENGNKRSGDPGVNKGLQKKNDQRNPEKDSAQALVNTDVKPQSLKKAKEKYVKKCRYCDDQHWSDQCNHYKTINDRKERIRGSCYKCLKEGHYFKDCKSNKSCVYCGETNVHHRSLCPQKFQIKTTMSNAVNEKVGVPDKSEEGGLMSMDEMVLMQTALTSIKGPDPNRVSEVRLFFDSGSHRSYITQRLARKLGLVEEGEQTINVVTFGSRDTKQIKTRYANIWVKLKNGTYFNMTVNVVPFISGELQRKPISELESDSVKDIVNSVVLADVVPRSHETCPIELLIGNDYYLDFILEEKLKIHNGLYLLASKIGWILSGRVGDTVKGKVEPNLLVMTYGSSLQTSDDLCPIDSSVSSRFDIEDFWKLESIGIVDQEAKSDDELALERFRNTIQFKNGRYYATWPWKEEEPDIPVNRQLAYGRLKTSVNRMKLKTDMLQKYDDVIKDQLQKGVIEKVEPNDIDGILHYIPHHAVITPQKSTTKLRIVYDASAKTKKENKSLNECLYRGPVLLHDLSGMLMRFRTYPIALVADIEKAFLQIGLRKDQRDVTRFLWLKNTDQDVTNPRNIQEYRFCRVPFGVISSPFLLAATINYHLDTYQSDFAEKIKSDIYVDNLITGTSTTTEAKELYRDAKRMFTDGAMNLREWVSNDKGVSSSFRPEDKEDVDKIKVLGHGWDCKTDTISFDHCRIPNSSLFLTKRIVLRTLASIFDPLGLVSPVLVPGKVFLQDLWREKKDWDEELDLDKKDKWKVITSSIDQLREVTVPRCICNAYGADTIYQLCCFCDASEKSYSAVIYLREVSEEGSRTNLLFSKSRLSPVKPLSIPRLELMAVVIGLCCIEFVQKQLKMNISNTFLWTDSQCVLSWINSTNKLTTFVKNRVAKIREYKNVSFFYVPSHENPADISTKGMSTRTLQKCQLWWKGPTWLTKTFQEWPINPCNVKDIDDKVATEEESESKGNEQSLSHSLLEATNDKPVSTVQSHPFGIEIGRFSSLTKLLRVTALVLRFIKKLKREKLQTQYVCSEELCEAELLWLKSVQNNHFKETVDTMESDKATSIRQQLGLFQDPSSRLLRCKGRMVNADLSEGARFPILLPKRDAFTDLVINRTHQELLHSGVAQTLSKVRLRFWIPQGRATVKAVIKRCPVCRRYEGGPYKMPPMCPLPSSRVTEACAFTRVGLDYLGPLYVKSPDGGKKVWVCLFTCLVTRAVHLELVCDMSSLEFLLCFRRFLSQRGTPHEIISDNALQFQLASSVLTDLWKDIVKDKDVLSYVSNCGIKWKFNVELAPWMGGFYERLVGLVKRSLKKTVGRRLLTIIQLQTLLKEIESVINTRPLVYLSDDVDSSIPLTPAHFLTINPRIGIPEIELSDDPDYVPNQSSKDKLIMMWKKGQKLLDTFWKIWRHEYLTSLRERTQSKLKCGRVAADTDPNVDDVVIIKDDSPRGSWRFGKVSKLVKSADGFIRSAKVELPSKRIIQRPLNLLYPLEVSPGKAISETESTKQESEKVDNKTKQVPKRVAARKALQKMKDIEEFQ